MNRNKALKTIIKYQETSKDDPTPIVLYALEGCNHFVPSKGGRVCQACGCHRLFHKRVKTEETQPTPASLKQDPSGSTLLPSTLPPHPPTITQEQDPQISASPLAPARPLSQSTFTQHKTEARISPPQKETNRKEIKVQSAGIKRKRTKFTTTQKEQMEAFANKINWRFRGQCKEEINQFCSAIGVTIQAFQTWICNHKSQSKSK